MKVITQRNLILDVVDLYEKSWNWHMDLRLLDGGTPRERLEQLKQLDLNTCEASVIDEITKDDTWVTPMCDNCTARPDRIVEISQDDRDTCHLCFDCVKEAYATMVKFLASMERR